MMRLNGSIPLIETQMRRILITITVSALLLTACTIYRIDVQQGNTLEAEKVAQLKKGMTKRQVQFLLGTPMLTDPFHPSRWDYVYTFKPGNRDMVKHHLTLLFENDSLVTIDKSEMNPALMDGKARFLQ